MVLWFGFVTKAVLVAHQGVFVAEQQSTHQSPLCFSLCPCRGQWEGTQGQLLSSDQTNISCLSAWCLAAKPGTAISKATSATQGLAGYQLGGG